MKKFIKKYRQRVKAILFSFLLVPGMLFSTLSSVNAAEVYPVKVEQAQRVEQTPTTVLRQEQVKPSILATPSVTGQDTTGSVTQTASPTVCSTQTPSVNPVGSNSVQTSSSPSPTTSDTSTIGNQNTGVNSQNTATSSTDTQNQTNNANTAVTNNQAGVNVATGGNSGQNINGNPTVTTGGITGSVNMTNTANQNATTTSGGTGETSNVANQNTGADSTNTGSFSANQTTITNNQNTLGSNQTSQVSGQTGNNTLSTVNGNPTIQSGDVNYSTAMVTTGNSNLTSDGGAKIVNIDIKGQHTGNIDLSNFGTANSAAIQTSLGVSNQNTGANSTNTASNTASQNTTTNNFNTADVNNKQVYDLSTGGNTTTHVNGDSTIKTGNVNVGATVVNFVNSNITALGKIVVGVINIFGTLIGDIILPGSNPTGATATATKASNTNTGANSNNTASTAVNTSTTTNNTNNLNLNNQIKVNSNTGNNNFQSVNGGLKVTTGTVDVKTQTATVANQNLTGSGGKETWWLVIINKMGQWVGQILGVNAQGQTIAGSEKSFALGSGNSNTGSNTNNTASATSNTSTNVNNTNNASVNNQLVINADTGHNTFDYNNGNNTLQTGKINVLANILNFINFDFTGKNWSVAIINVFGKWFGNVVTPDYKNQQGQQSDTHQTASVDTKTTTPKTNTSTTHTTTNNTNTVSQEATNNPEVKITSDVKMLTDTTFAKNTSDSPMGSVFSSLKDGFSYTNNGVVTGNSAVLAADSRQNTNKDSSSLVYKMPVTDDGSNNWWKALVASLALPLLGAAMMIIRKGH